jgi:hypothetical protein
MAIAPPPATMSQNDTHANRIRGFESFTIHVELDAMLQFATRSAVNNAVVYFLFISRYLGDSPRLVPFQVRPRAGPMGQRRPVQP